MTASREPESDAWAAVYAGRSGLVWDTLPGSVGPASRCSPRTAPRLFVWTKTADEILASLARYCTRINETINDSGHPSGVRNPPRPPGSGGERRSGSRFFAARDELLSPVVLPDRFDVGQSPCLVEPRFQRTVEPDYREPALAGQGLDPVAAAFGPFGTEVDVD
ncbi:hypothetical protein Rruber_02352 [Rhodococcus ruber]